MRPAADAVCAFVCHVGCSMASVWVVTHSPSDESPFCCSFAGELDIGYRITVAARDGRLYSIKGGALSRNVIQLDSQPVGVVGATHSGCEGGRKYISRLLSADSATTYSAGTVYACFQRDPEGPFLVQGLKLFKA